MQDFRPRLNADPGLFAEGFDRLPFGYEHNLHELNLFEDDSLRWLAAKCSARDYFVARGAPAASTDFYDVQHGRFTPMEALARLENGQQRILLKRPEHYDQRFRDLLFATFRCIVEAQERPYAQRIVRLESAVLISSNATITPFHFDPELSFFFQISGEKAYHIYAPAAVSESELERFYLKGIVNIGQLSLDGRDRSLERIFGLRPGRGFHQPRNSPHWVETADSRSVSYIVSLETIGMRQMGKTRAFNYYLRKAGIRPPALGANPRMDALKAATMSVVIGARKRVRGALSKSAR